MKSLTQLFTLFALATSTLAEHFYTTDPHGELAPGLGYHLEGAACWVSTTQQSGTVPSTYLLLFAFLNSPFTQN